MGKLVKLDENTLRSIVKKSVHGILKEYSPVKMYSHNGKVGNPSQNTGDMMIGDFDKMKDYDESFNECPPLSDTWQTYADYVHNQPQDYDDYNRKREMAYDFQDAENENMNQTYGSQPWPDENLNVYDDDPRGIAAMAALDPNDELHDEALRYNGTPRSYYNESKLHSIVNKAITKILKENLKR